MAGRAFRALGEGIRRVGSTAGLLDREREEQERVAAAEARATQDRDLQLALGGIQRGAVPTIAEPIAGPGPLASVIPEPDPRFEQLTPDYFRADPTIAAEEARVAGIDRTARAAEPFLPEGVDAREYAVGSAAGIPASMMIPEPEPADPLAREKYNVGEGFTPSGANLRDGPTMSTEEANSEALTAISQYRADDGSIDWDDLLKTAPPPPVRNAILRYRNQQGEIDFGLAGPTFEAGGGGVLTGDPAVDAILQGLGGGERVRRGPGGGFGPAAAPEGGDRPTMAARVAELQAEGKSKEEARAIMLQEGYNVGGR